MILSALGYILSASCSGLSLADVADGDLSGGDEAEEGGSFQKEAFSFPLKRSVIR